MTPLFQRVFLQPVKARQVHLGLGQAKKMHRTIGMPDMPLFKGGVIHARCKPSLTHWEASPLYTKCTQSWQGAKTLYNTARFHACGTTQGYGNTVYPTPFQGYGDTAYFSYPDIWVREPD